MELDAKFPQLPVSRNV